MSIIDEYQNFIKKYPKSTFHYRGDVLGYRLFGSGEKLIVLLIGNSMFASDAYFKLQEELSKYAQILTIEDMTMKISIDRITDCLSFLIKLLQFKKVTLLGMSHGGGIAQAFARDHASQTENIILYNTLTKPKKHSDVSKTIIEGVLKSIDELKELRKILPLNSIKLTLLNQIREALSSDDDYELFELLVSKYTETNEKQQMDIIKDLLSNYAFDKSDFKYLNYRSLIFYGYDDDPLGGSDLIESLVDVMTNPVLKFIDTDRFQLILDPLLMVDAVIEFMKFKQQKSAL